MIPGSANPLFFHATDGGYTLAKSLRFRSSASAYLSRTLGTPTLNTKLTFSGWVKRGTLGSNGVIFSLGQSTGTNNYLTCQFTSTNALQVYGFATSNNMDVSTASVFRDTSAWYHFVVVIDTTQSTGSDRVKIYLNGVQQAVTTTVTIGLGAAIPANVSGYIGGISALLYNAAYVSFLDGYMAEVNFIDGQALDATSFGQTDNNGVWQPKAYTGTYGTNGFYLKFADASGATATTIGKDSSPNGNNWTPNNISVTSGITYDSMLDSPTNFDDGGNGVGNYCVLNPLSVGANTTLSEANLKATNTASHSSVRGTIGVTSGKWYWEVTALTTTGNIGIETATANLGAEVGNDANGWGYLGTGQKYTSATLSAYGSSYTTNDVIAVALDADNGAIYFGKISAGSITWQNSGDPTSGATKTGAAFTGLTNGPYFPAVGNLSATQAVNFGQRFFSATPPSNFKALNTQNLTTPTIMNGAAYMDATIYTGNGSSSRTFTGELFSPDLVWIKGRSGATDHALYDAVRGVQLQLESNNTGAETTESTGLTAFTADGFTIGSLAQINTNAATYVAWLWDKSVTSGFDIVTYTGNGANRTISHSLNTVPSMIIVKQRTASSTTNWAVYHSSLANTEYILLNTTGAKATGATYWNSTTPTSSVFSLGTAADVNTNSGTYVAYCFAPVAGYSAFGSYTGNGSTDGPFVYMAFRPRYILTKRTDSTGSWEIYDTSRDTYNVMSADLAAESSAAETSTARFDALSNGFKVRTTSTATNASGGTYIYAAFAENPFKISRAR